MSSPDRVTVDVAGVYDMDEADYHADPCPEQSLSYSGAKVLLDCPARYDWQQANPIHRDDFDFGSAAHAHILGIGAPVDIIDADDWRTKAAREARDESRTEGRTPLLTKDWETVQAMADALRQHPTAASLLDPKRGHPERSAFWFDRVWRRCRYDFLPDVDPNRRLIIPDYKTVRGHADTGSISRTVARFRYHMQAAWYLAGARAVLDVAEPAFVFIFQEREPPYLVNVVELDSYAVEIGAAMCERAVDVFVECTETGVWPGYGDDVKRVSLPRWAELAFENGDDDQ